MAKQKSDLSRAFSEDGAIKTHVGGQALIEGVMMRGKYNWAVAVREPSGAIYVEEHDLKSGQDKNGWMYWPLVRGCRALVESLMLGFKALEIAALHAFGDEEGEQKAAAEASAGAVDYETTLTEDAETLAGMLLAIKGDFPKDKEPLVFGRCRFLVLEITDHRINEVRVKVMPDIQD